jgi:cold shock CspA family protein
MNTVKRGVIDRFGARGFGFLIELGTRRTYFVHIRDVIGRIALQTGDVVEFQAGPDRPGMATAAIQVRLIESPDRLDREQAPIPSAHSLSNWPVSQQPSAAQPTSTEGGSR